MKTSVFAFDNYKDALRSFVQENGRSWGNITRLSEAAGCQRSYLSRVISSDLHLTPDHLFGISEYAKLSVDEAEYLMVLLQTERAANLAYRKQLVSKSLRMKKQFNDLQEKMKRPPASLDEKDFAYYSSWLFSALHIISSISGCQTTKAIAERLQISHELTESTLEQLLTWDLVKFQRGKWEFANSERHVGKSSPLVTFHHQNWRQRAILDAQDFTSEGIHFTVVQSLSRSAFEKVKSKLLEFIEDANKIAGPSESEKLVCLAADFFEV